MASIQDKHAGALSQTILTRNKPKASHHSRSIKRHLVLGALVSIGRLVGGAATAVPSQRPHTLGDFVGDRINGYSNLNPNSYPELPFSYFLHGYGERAFASGYKEQGLFQQNSLIKGTIIFPDGSIKKGAFVNQVLDGENCYTRNSVGDEESGPFINGKLHGYGKRQLHSGYTEEGQFTYGTLKSGSITLPDKTILKGSHFSNLQLQGIGQKDFTDGYSETGTFIDNVLIEGKRYWNASHFEEGSFSGNLLEGNGFAKRSPGIEEGGIFANGKLHGQGERRFDRLHLERGIFKHGVLIEGMIVTRDTVFKGYFVNGKLQGDGLEIGSIHKRGTFNQGALIKGDIIDHDKELFGEFEGNELVNGVLIDTSSIIHRRYIIEDKKIVESALDVTSLAAPLLFGSLITVTLAFFYFLIRGECTAAARG